MLCEKFVAANIVVKQAQNDADVFIIETAIEQFSSTNPTIVVGEDVDLLIILTARTPTDKIVYFLKPGRAQVQKKIYSSQSLSAYPKCQPHILLKNEKYTERPNCNRDLKDLRRTAAIIQWLTFVNINFMCSNLHRLFLKIICSNK